jgi:hypothetical protein
MNRNEQFLIRLAGYIPVAVLLCMGVLLIVEIGISVNWRMVHDPPILYYISFLIDKHDYVPYLDTYEFTFPGGLIFHWLIGKCFGYGDAAFRTVDIVLFGFLFLITMGIIRPLGRLVALAGFLIFGLLYMGYGPYMSLQRDYLAIIPVALAVLLVSGGHSQKFTLIRLLSTGFLVGMAATVKPHQIICIIPLLMYFYWRWNLESSTPGNNKIRQTVLIVLITVSGVLIAVSIPVLWLWFRGGLPAFWELITCYLPLYTQLTGDHTSVSGPEYLGYILRSYRKLGGMTPLLIPACLGLYIAFFEVQLSHTKKLLIGLITGLAFCFSVYPVLAGKFWHYHWMPFRYFISLCAGLVFISVPTDTRSIYRRLFPVIILCISLLFVLKPPPEFFKQIRGGNPTPPKYGRVDKMAEFLIAHMKPGDTVQPLDWTGGSLHAMLLARAVPANPFIQDVCFYHHVSNPFIRDLRKRFMTALENNQPRFVLQVHERPRHTGLDTSDRFPELEEFLAQYYYVALEGDGFRILERKNTHK